MKIFKLSEEDYKGSHTAPVPSEHNSLYDLSDVFPDDIYGPNGAQYYGHAEPFDNISIQIIQSARNKPNYPITIYRAIPDFDYDVKVKIKELYSVIHGYNQFNFFPMNNQIVDDLRKKYPIDNYTYDEQQTNIYKDVENQIDELENSINKKSIKINAGDWVTICRPYAKLHGESTLLGKYKILSKKVKAKDLYTDGNSIHEWGYHPS